MKSKRNMLGLEVIYDANGVIRETDLAQCNHCQSQFDVRPKESVTDAGGYCTNCDGLVCPRCANIRWLEGRCETWEQALDREETEQKMLNELREKILNEVKI